MSISKTSSEEFRNGESTFIHNMSLPVHSWYRFPAGFSAEWAQRVIENHRETIGELALLDPFAGVGTTVLAGETTGVRARGVEAQPFIQRIAAAKLLWRTNPGEFHDFARAVAEQAGRSGPMPHLYPRLIAKCYGNEALDDLNSLRCAWEELNDSSPKAQLAWLALVSILRVCSSAGTAPWQYVLPAKTKSKVLAPFDAFNFQVRKMLADMTLLQMEDIRNDAYIFLDDARSLETIADDSVGLVITSPPYANNYDYGDATRLEMTFFGEVASWGDVHDKARKKLVRSCSQHASIEKLELWPLLNEINGTTFIDEITAVCKTLAVERLAHGGKRLTT